MINPKNTSEFEAHRQQVFHATSTEMALQKLAARGHEVGTVIDIGASSGSWTTIARRFWPQSRALFFEANPSWEAALRDYCQHTPNTEYVMAAAGPEPGETLFHSTPGDDFSGAVVAAGTGHSFTVRVSTVDAEVTRRSLPGPYLLKFDTHGYEREILRGSTQTLQQTGIVVMEMYFFQNEQKRFPQMCLLLESLGFRCIDLCELLHRDHDFSLWQFDGIFVRQDAPEIQFDRYHI